MKVLVCGSRNWVDQAPIERELAKLPKGTIVVHGGCRGADMIAGYVAQKLGFTVRVYMADWKADGRAAGPIRNRRMLAEEHPDKDGVPLDQVIAFHKDPGLGIGTKDMKILSEKAGLTVHVHLR